jgi:hypothetical protein
VRAARGDSTRPRRWAFAEKCPGVGVGAAVDHRDPTRGSCFPLAPRRSAPGPGSLRSRERSLCVATGFAAPQARVRAVDRSQGPAPSWSAPLDESARRARAALRPRCWSAAGTSPTTSRTGCRGRRGAGARRALRDRRSVRHAATALPRRVDAVAASERRSARRSSAFRISVARSLSSLWPRGDRFTPRAPQPANGCRGRVGSSIARSVSPRWCRTLGSG